jgi:hypothetical protein
MPLPDVPPAIALPHIGPEFETAAAPPAQVSGIRPRCDAGKPGEIVVCAHDLKRDRLTPLPESPPEGLPKAELRVSDTMTIDLHGESGQLLGASSNRAMVGVKIGF